MLNSQKIILHGSIGCALNNQKANGTGMEMGIFYQINTRNSIGLFLGNSFLESDNYIPKKIQPDFHLRDKSNIIPISEYLPFYWREESFPGYSLRSKPNRYNYSFLFAKYSIVPFPMDQWQFGLGLGCSYFDFMFIDQVVELVEYTYDFPNIRVKQDKSIPIFSFNSFYDLGGVFDIQYRIKNFKRLSTAIQGKVTWFPISSNWIYSLGINLSWKKK